MFDSGPIEFRIAKHSKSEKCMPSANNYMSSNYYLGLAQPAKGGKPTALCVRAKNDQEALEMATQKTKELLGGNAILSVLLSRSDLQLVSDMMDDSIRHDEASSGL